MSLLTALGGWVTYKAMFEPYLTWWQHSFPVMAGEDKRPLLKAGAAVIDTSSERAIIQEFQMSEIHTLLSPEELHR